MLYSKTITIPANTLLSNPLKKQFIIREKVITKIEVMIDIIATKSLVGVKLFGGKPDFRVFSFPVDSADWIRKSEVWIGRIELLEVNLPVDIEGISPGAIKDHIVIISIHTEK